ncbi:MAG: Hsp20/alpha crystallin family protein [Candidatus Hodarchaeota archaeon]
MRDDFDDIIDEIKKYFKLDSDIFDIDVLFIPEKNIDLRIKPYDKNTKGFKISYHFEAGMDKPEIKIEGNIDDKKIKDFLENVDINKYPKLRKLIESRLKKEIDANELTLETSCLNQEEEVFVLEPYTEINEAKEYYEILIEVPGIERGDVKIDFNVEGKILMFTAQNKKRKYCKEINLPSKLLNANYELDVNNGITYIKVKKKIS